MKNEEIARLDFSNWPLPDSYLIEIGRIASLWAGLESFLNLCIGKLAGFDVLKDQKPFALVTHATFPQKLDMLGSLCAHLVEEFPNLEKHKDVIASLRSAQKLRNNFMHYGMTMNEESGKVEMATSSARGTLKFSVEKVDLVDIRRAAMTIHEAQLALYKLVLKADITPIWTRR